MKKSSNIIEEYIIEGYHEEPLVVDKIEQKLFQLSSYVRYNKEEIIIYTIGRNCDYSTLSELIEKLRRLV